jgi:GNAT superfamily N-acetyltransferase
MGSSSIATNAVRRSNQQCFEQLSQRATLDCGEAYYSTRYADLPFCNFVAEVSLAQVAGVAFETVEAFYRKKELRCYIWIPAADQSVNEVARLLAPHGFTCRETIAMVHTGLRAALRTDERIRIVGARALRRAYTSVITQRFAESRQSTASLVNAQLERLNDPHYEAFVALIGNEPAGTITVHQVGEIGRIRDVYVIPELRRRGVSLAMLDYALASAVRWASKPICTAISAENTIGRTLLTREGFKEGGTIVSFSRPLTGEVPQ